MLLAPAAVYLVLFLAVVITALRPPRSLGAAERLGLVELFLLGVACQCLHMLEEFLTGLHLVYPPLFGLAPLSGEFFVTFNVAAIALWVLAAAGILRGMSAAYFPVWFLALACCLNLVFHPLLSLYTGGYFPGLLTSPLVGLMGILITRRLFQLTDPAHDRTFAEP
ncbi:MAG TPA: HXXEE domain-containing protein [Acidobacteriota bacterium]|nr:HXXEE domain-containing protein [Acidobacteriota bacterium]